jgi:hypothetical protein
MTAHYEFDAGFKKVVCAVRTGAAAVVPSRCFSLCVCCCQAHPSVSRWEPGPSDEDAGALTLVLENRCARGSAASTEMLLRVVEREHYERSPPRYHDAPVIRVPAPVGQLSVQYVRLGVCSLLVPPDPVLRASSDHAVVALEFTQSARFVLQCFVQHYVVGLGV